MSGTEENLTAQDPVGRQVLIDSIVPEPNEDAIALAFAERFKHDLRFDHTQGKWMQWDGARWKLEFTKLAFDWARGLCREINKHHQNVNLPKIRTASAVEKAAQADRRLAVEFNHWNQNPWLLCTPEGTVELKSGLVRENRQSDCITKCTQTSPRKMDTPLWNQFLRDATQGDDSLIRFLKIISGYCLTGVTVEHALFFLFGPGGNGKGVFVNTLASVLGEYHVAANMEMFTASKFDRHPTELARLHGARLVTASETEEGKPWAESRIKQLTGGDPIAGRYMRRDFFQYIPEFKLVFLGNHKPVLRNVDDANRRRFNIIPFVHRPTQPDKDLPEKLKDEYPGILHWAIEGCFDWQANGLMIPEVVERETASYFDDQDIFSQWLTECTERKSQGTGEPSQRLFTNWKDWAVNQGEDPGSSKSFSEKMIGAGYQLTKHTPGNHDKRGFLGVGIRIKSDDWNPYRD